ncbi:MAG: carbohydrate-binding protein CenC [Opitutaceae bacterium]|jgi:alpha-N-arabinofuranosidase|nr:carbohydrate-binding protein CenC [Opitutaceae bacterium]
MPAKTIQTITLKSSLTVLPLLAGSLWAPAVTGAEINPETDARIVIRADQPGRPVNRLILGHNIEAADSAGIFGTRHSPSNDGQGFWNPQNRSSVAVVVEQAKAIGMGALRYPGGCLVHNFNWKAAVGPLESRPDFQFGIDEWIKLCRELDAEPVFTVSDYYGTAEEAAELVEYLNAPATPEHPWAMKRAAWGNPEPYGVKWFELGNETDHGTHQMKPFRKWTPAEYVSWASEYADKMRAVDPSIKLGTTTVPGDGTNVECEWNQAVYRDAAPFSDFIIVHFYAPKIPGEIPGAQARAVNHSVLAAPDQLRYRLREYREAVLAASGRDLPLAVTEYNVSAPRVTNPVPYRFSFAAALFSVDFMRSCLEPDSGVVMANYWHFINGWWGMLQTENGGKTIHERAAFPVFRLFGQNLGPTLLTTENHVPLGEFPGIAGGLARAFGQGTERRLGESLGKIHLPARFPAAPVAGTAYTITAAPDQQGLVVEFDHHAGDAYPNLFRLPTPPSAQARGVAWHVSFEARMESKDRTAPASFGTFGLGLADGRGWDATASAVAITGAERSTGGWISVSNVYNGLADASEVQVIARFETGKAFTGRLEMRNLRIEAHARESFPAYPLLTTTASISEDGRTLRLIVFNKSLDRKIPAVISPKGFAAATASYAELTDDLLSIVAAKEKHGEAALTADGSLRHEFPPASVTGITLQRRQ